MKNLERLFAEKLLKIKAIKLQPANPFTWASGWKSPFYCDNRKTLSYPSLRNFVKIEITRLILERFGQVDAIAGVATGDIPQGGMVAAYTYGFPVAEEAFKNAKVPLVTLTNYEAVLDVALRTGYIEEEDIATLNEWRKDPAHWDAGK